MSWFGFIKPSSPSTINDPDGVDNDHQETASPDLPPTGSAKDVTSMQAEAFDNKSPTTQQLHGDAEPTDVVYEKPSRELVCCCKLSPKKALDIGFLNSVDCLDIFAGSSSS